MDEVRLARAAHLSAMLARREDVGLLQQLLVEVGLVGLHFVEDVFEADHGCFRNRVLMLTVPGERRAASGERASPARRTPLAGLAGPPLAHHASGWRAPPGPSE